MLFNIILLLTLYKIILYIEIKKNLQIQALKMYTNKIHKSYKQTPIPFMKTFYKFGEISLHEKIITMSFHEQLFLLIINSSLVTY